MDPVKIEAAKAAAARINAQFVASKIQAQLKQQQATAVLTSMPSAPPLPAHAGVTGLPSQVLQQAATDAASRINALFAKQGAPTPAPSAPVPLIMSQTVGGTRRERGVPDKTAEQKLAVARSGISDRELKGMQFGLHRQGFKPKIDLKQTRLLVGMEVSVANGFGFPLVEKLTGAKNQNLVYIMRQCPGALLALHGMGADVGDQKDPLHVLISGQQQRSVDSAKILADQLIMSVRREFDAARHLFTQRQSMPPPAVGLPPGGMPMMQMQGNMQGPMPGMQPMGMPPMGGMQPMGGLPALGPPMTQMPSPMSVPGMPMQSLQPMQSMPGMQTLHPGAVPGAPLSMPVPVPVPGSVPGLPTLGSTGMHPGYPAPVASGPGALSSGPGAAPSSGSAGAGGAEGQEAEEIDPSLGHDDGRELPAFAPWLAGEEGSASGSSSSSSSSDGVAAASSSSGSSSPDSGSDVGKRKSRSRFDRDSSPPGQEREGKRRRTADDGASSSSSAASSSSSSSSLSSASAPTPAADTYDPFADALDEDS